jgi:hypothetical protein
MLATHKEASVRPDVSAGPPEEDLFADCDVKASTPEAAYGVAAGLQLTSGLP